MATYDAGLNAGAVLRLTVDQIGQNIGENYSTDEWHLYLVRGTNTASWTGSPISWGVNVDGVTWGGSFTFDFRSSALIEIASGTTNRPHNADGTKTISVAASMGSTGTAVGGPAELTGTFGQTTIPRASKPNWSPGTVDPTQLVSFDTQRASQAFTHNLTWFFGQLSGTIANGVGQTTSWDPPDNLATQIPNAVYGVGVFRTDTFSGGSFVGRVDQNFAFVVPGSWVPTIGALAVSEGNPAVTAAGIGAFVQGVSKLTVAMSGEAGIQGSTISARKVEAGGQALNLGSGTMPAPIGISGASVPVVGTVTDSRGSKGTKTTNIAVLPWTPPKILAASVQRATSAGVVDEQGTYIKVNLNVAVASLKPATVEKNSLTYRISTRQRGTTAWTVKKTFAAPAGTISFNSYDLISAYPITQAFEVLIEVIDKFATSSAGSTIATSKVFMHWGGQNEGLGLGKFWERGGLDVLDEIYHRDGGIVQPSGMITPYAGATAPAGWMICDGSAISRITYAKLFAIIGTQYGTGDGTNTFNLPNLKGRVVVGVDAAQTEFDTRGEVGGAKTHTLSVGEMPLHSHSPAAIVDTTPLKWGTAQAGTTVGVMTGTGGTNVIQTNNTGGGGAHNNLQPYMAMPYIIKT